MRKLLLIISILTLCSCSSSKVTSSIPNTSIPDTSIPESSEVLPTLPTSDPNDIGGDNLQSDWEW